MPLKLLFLCTHNACRSILAESIARLVGEGLWEVASAGSHPAGKVHPATLAALDERGLPIASLTSKSWDDLTDYQPDIVITVCDQAAGESCPIWFGKAVKGHWGLPDPSKETDPETQQAQFRLVMDTLEQRLRTLADAVRDSASADELSTCLQTQANHWAVPVSDLPNIEARQFEAPTTEQVFAVQPSGHKPRILLLYGSLRERSFSRLAAEEAARLLKAMGAEPRIFNPRGLPLADAEDDSHPKVQELRDLAEWSEGMVWCSPERHGAMTGIMKTQIDWIPLSIGGMRPTQGKTLAVMQVCGGSQSFNAVNQLRVLGRWMRMITIPNQSSVPKAFTEFDDNNRMLPSPYYNRIVDVMEELVKFTLLTRDRSDYLTDRYSERVESAEEVSKRVNQRSM